jgi:IPT/TIG domain
MKTLKTLTLLLFLTIVACSKDDSPETTALTSNLAISSISPNSGTKTTAVVITGIGFSPNATSNTVTLNGKTCPITSASATQLNITIPPAAGTGNIKVAVAGFEKESTLFTFIETVTVSTLAGNGTIADVNGTGTSAQFRGAFFITTDSSGNIFVTDANKIKKITPNGVVTTFAGSGAAGFADGTGTEAIFKDPNGITTDIAGNIYVFDNGNNKLRKITPSGVVSTIAGSTAGYQDGQGNIAKFSASVFSITTDPTGNIFVCDRDNGRIRKVSPTGLVSTFAGSNTFGTINGLGQASSFSTPYQIAIDKNNNLFVTQYTAVNPFIRRITPDGLVSTYAGTTQGSADGTLSTAQFNIPSGITFNLKGDIFVTEDISARIRKISTDGIVTTIAGGSSGFQDGLGTVAKFQYAASLAIDKNDNIYVADGYRIRKIVID